ncbi:MAG TPA: hypothetical protein VJ438_00120, partial [Candidatus Nanoarchaeia archaeon]|nr:hypothetical protein [Candidatus Nanoarchaeia archaeon]
MQHPNDKSINPKEFIKFKMQERTFKEAIIKALKTFGNALPLIFGTILLISLLVTWIPQSFYLKIFQGNVVIDPFIGSFIGSISAGNPVVSYIIGGELLKQGVNLIAVTAFIVAWVTVGFIQLPAESMILGKRFALYRNILSFIFAIIVAIITVAIFEV